jgi:hypothetical protein
LCGTVDRGSRTAEAAGLALLAGRTLVVSDPRTGDEDYTEADGEVGRAHLRVAALAARLERFEVLEILLGGGEVVRPAAAWRLM